MLSELMPLLLPLLLLLLLLPLLPLPLLALSLLAVLLLPTLLTKAAPAPPTLLLPLPERGSPAVGRGEGILGFGPTLLLPLPERGSPTLEKGVPPVELAVMSKLDEAAGNTAGLLELLVVAASKPAAAAADGKVPLAEGERGAGERYPVSGEAGDAVLTPGLCLVPLVRGDKEGEAD